MKYSQKIEYKLVREPEAIYNKVISCSKDIADWWKKLEDSDTEKFITVCMNNRNDIICFDMVASGTVNYNTVHIREVLKSAILTGASSIIIVHNHPSGQLKPSDADIAITKKIKEAAWLFEIILRYHIIIGVDNYYSFADNLRI